MNTKSQRMKNLSVSFDAFSLFADIIGKADRENILKEG